MTRTPLPFKRHGITQPVKFIKDHREWTFDVTFAVGEDGRVQEAFMRTTKEGNDLGAILRDGCILLSLLLQHGDTAEVIAAAMEEDRPEGAPEGPPSSPLGAIARAAADIDQELRAARTDG